MAEITVEEASETYLPAMSNPLPDQAGVCSACRTFTSGDWERCYPCHAQNEMLDVVVPITYSVDCGQMHHALRGYKDGDMQTARFAQVRLAAILWRFLEQHEVCIAGTVGIDDFDVVTTVPSTAPDRNAHHPLPVMVGWCGPLKERYKLLLEPTGEPVVAHQFAFNRYRAVHELWGENVLLIDDTWTTGGNARSAAYALKSRGASTVACVVIGRHISPGWTVGRTTSGELVAALAPFDWDTCCICQSTPD